MFFLCIKRVHLVKNTLVQRIILDEFFLGQISQEFSVKLIEFGITIVVVKGRLFFGLKILFNNKETVELLIQYGFHLLVFGLRFVMACKKFSILTPLCVQKEQEESSQNYINKHQFWQNCNRAFDHLYAANNEEGGTDKVGCDSVVATKEYHINQVGR